jgi:hypothetical protein
MARRWLPPVVMAVTALLLVTATLLLAVRTGETESLFTLLPTVTTSALLGGRCWSGCDRAIRSAGRLSPPACRSCLGSSPRSLRCTA